MATRHPFPDTSWSAGARRQLRRLGVPRDDWRDIYYQVLEDSWSRFYLILTGFYLVVNCLFATLYWLQPGCIAEPHRGNWLEDFFFSFETIATVGFGVEHPVTLYAHWVVTLEILVAVLALPLATGLIIVKFARPYARVTFSRNAVVVMHDGFPTLMFRLANMRANQIYDARIAVTLLRFETTLEGRPIRRLITLPTLRDTNPMFFLSWTVMHRLDETSPLFGVDWTGLRPGELDIMAVMTGLDATTSSPVHARHLYASQDVLVDHTFEDIVSTDLDGTVTIDYSLLHQVNKVIP